MLKVLGTCRFPDLKMKGIPIPGQEPDPGGFTSFSYPKGRGKDPYVACTRSGEGALRGPFPLASFGNKMKKIDKNILLGTRQDNI